MSVLRVYLLGFTSIYFYLLSRVYLLYLLITLRTTPRSKLREESFGEKLLEEKSLTHSYLYNMDKNTVLVYTNIQVTILVVSAYE